MSAELKTRLATAMKAAMKAKDKPRLQVIRGLQAAVKQIEIDKKIELNDDAEILAVLDKALKQRRDSLQQYEQAQRSDLAEQEAYEMTIIQEFMPAALSKDEINQMIEACMQKINATSMQDMGKVMGLLKADMQGRADMSEVSKLIKAKLT